MASPCGEISSSLTVKTLTGMTTDVYPRENCIAPAIVLPTGELSSLLTVNTLTGMTTDVYPRENGRSA